MVKGILISRIKIYPACDHVHEPEKIGHDKILAEGDIIIQSHMYYMIVRGHMLLQHEEPQKIYGTAQHDIKQAAKLFSVFFNCDMCIQKRYLSDLILSSAGIFFGPVQWASVKTVRPFPILRRPGIKDPALDITRTIAPQGPYFKPLRIFS